MEVYSIDESFFGSHAGHGPHGSCPRVAKAHHALDSDTQLHRHRPHQTLAKAGNKLAKKGSGIVDLSDSTVCTRALESLAVGDVWGVGRRWSAKLDGLGITTARELRDAPSDLILQRFGVVMNRTQRELQGHSYIGLQEAEPDRQQIVVSRSFGERVEDHQAVAQAIYSFAERACQKVRGRQLVCSALAITAESDRFRPNLPQHSPARSYQFTSATSDTCVVLKAARHLLNGFLKAGIGCKRAGIVLMDLARPEFLQADLFAPVVNGNAARMATKDKINVRFGRGCTGLGATGWQVRPVWSMRQSNLSPRYTTRVADIPIARC